MAKLKGCSVYCQKNMTMQHLRNIEKIASIQRCCSNIEWKIPGDDYRVDVQVFTPEGNYGVEIQETPLSLARINEKIRMLKRNFYCGILVMPKQMVSRFKYLETDEVSICTIKEAINMIRDEF